MVLGPTLVYKCPNCSNILRRGTLVSGNTIGIKMFSDGNNKAPMLRQYPNLTKCNKCETIFWLSKLKEIARYEWGFDKISGWEDGDDAKFLEIGDYFKALKNGIFENKTEELLIRRGIWWAYNDRIKKGQNIFVDEDDETQWTDNLKKLINILDKSNTDQKIILAEINRNLGEFENCIAIIESIDDENLNWLKEKFVNESKLKNRWLVKLN